MPPCSVPPLLAASFILPPKEQYRVGGEGGPLGVGRCSTSLYKDALVNPKSAPLAAASFVDKSVSSLLEHCLGWDALPEGGEEEEVLATPLLQACASHLALPALRLLLTQGSDLKMVSSRGRTALHLLLSPQHAPTVPHLLLPAASLLVEAGAPLDHRDGEGATPLLSLARLLELGQFSLAAELAALLLTSHLCDVNSVNSAGRSLLSYSVTYLDSAAELTRVLVNHGARVWPGPEPGPSVEEIRRDKEQSAFTWLLRAVIRQRGLGGTDNSLNSLCHEMGRAPKRMKVSLESSHSRARL